MIFMSIWQHLDNCSYLRRMHIASRIGFSSSGVPALEIERFDDLTTPPTTRGMIARDRNDNILQPTSVCVIHRTLAKSQLNQRGMTGRQDKRASSTHCLVLGRTLKLPRPRQDDEKASQGGHQPLPIWADVTSHPALARKGKLPRQRKLPRKRKMALLGQTRRSDSGVPHGCRVRLR
jgi:hypothetical protein